jgi:hypothetical protein
MQYYYDNAISPINVMLVAPGNAEPSYTGYAIITQWDQPGPVEGVVTYSGALQGKLGYTTQNIF